MMIIAFIGLAANLLSNRIHRLVNEGRVQVITPFRIYGLRKLGNGIALIGELNGDESILEGIDEVIANTGSRPDFTFLREIRMSIDPATERRAPTFLMATGYEQVHSIVPYLTGNFVSAKKVELVLPETEVRSINLASTKKNESCCKSPIGSC